MKQIYLASGSPRRKDMMYDLVGNSFNIISSPYEEDNSLSLPPHEIVKLHSLGKAKAAASNLSEGIVIGSDCLLYHNGRVLGKPGTLEKAEKSLESIAGNEIQAFSGIALVDSSTGQELVDYDSAKIYLRDISPEEIKYYVQREKPIGNAGGLIIQGAGAVFVEKVEGDYNSIVGMPLFKLHQLLERMKVNIYDYKK